MAVEARTVSNRIRRVVWPVLLDYGFSFRGTWAVWREIEGHIDVVDLTTVGRQADAVGCTSVSLNVFVASVPAWFSIVAADNATARPRYWEAPIRCRLNKSLTQPWFRPFADPRRGTRLPSVAAHRQALRRVFRGDIHDRPDIWYVLDDGSNLDEVLEDVTAVVTRTGVPTLDRFHDPSLVVQMILTHELPMSADRALIEAAERVT
jgi:hypothetical protein